MKNTNKKHFFIQFTIILIFIGVINAQPQCHINRFPEVVPLQYGQEASINLQEYIWGNNITYSVQPNDFHSNVQPQYTCKKIWSHRLGKIIQTQHYQAKLSNSTNQIFIAMLGGSSYFNDFFMVYYGVRAVAVDTLKQRFYQDDVQVLQVPRYKLKNCMKFVVTSNGTHAEFLLDCMSPDNPMNKIMAITTISLQQPTPVNPQWTMFQSPIYLPQQLIPTLNITSSISIIQTSNKMKYLIRVIMTQYADYIEVWRWSVDDKQIIGVYDSGYFMDQGVFLTNDIDLRKMQVISNTILVMDLLNGLHILQISKTGALLYRTTLQMDTFSTFYYQPKQQLLFMAKRGIIEHFEVKIFSSISVKANRVDRYHLYGFEEINQMVIQGRYLYVSTNMFMHIIHLTDIPSNDQQYDGSYNVYPQLYNQMMIPLAARFVKVDAAQALVDIQICETHPPFLHLKAPQFSNQFTINAKSVINGISSECKLKLKTILVQADDDNVYLNGYESENETVFSNRPGRAIMDLDKYAIGKNLEYEISLYNHQIQFQYKIRKVNNQSCQIKRLTNQKNRQGSSSLSTTISNVTKTFSVGNWLIVQHPEDRVKEYYKCEKYTNIQCNFIQLYITSATYTKAAYQLLEQEKTKKQSVLEAVLFQQNNQYIIEVILVTQTQKKLSQQVQEQQNLTLVRSLCRIKFPQGQQFKVGQIKLREDKLYVVLPNMKQVRIYEALLSFQENQQCHYFGNLNLSSFRQHGLYFSPKHIDFDKQQLSKPYQVPSFAFSQQKIQSITQSVDVMFIAQFNQVLVVSLTIGANIITRIQLIKQLVLDRNTEANDIQLIVTSPNLLAVDRTQKIISQYYLSHTFDRTYVRSYSFFSKDNVTDGNIRLIDSNTFAVMAQPDAQNHSYAQVYQIDSIVSAFTQFAKFQIDGTFHVMNFDQDQYQFLTAKLQQSTTLQLICNSTTLTPSPYVEIQIPKPKNDDEPSKQQFFLSSYTLKDSRRQVVTLQVASDASDIEKGTQYPYTTYTMRIQEDASQAYFEIDDLKWFQGNVWSHRYVCNDCKTGRIKFEDKISLKERIQLQSFNVPNDFYVTKMNDFQEQYTFETIQGYLLTKMQPQSQNNTWLSVEKSLKGMFEDSLTEQSFDDEQNKNVTYTFSQSLILSSNIENDPKCVKASPQDHDLYFVSMCSDYEFLDESALIQLRLYSTTGFKPFIVHQYLIEIGELTSIQNLKASTKVQKQLIVMSSSLSQQEQNSYDTLFVRFDDNIWIFLIVNGKLELIYTVDKVDFGPNNHLCWIEVIKQKVQTQTSDKSGLESDQIGKTITQYGVIASMCQTGLYHIVFTVDPPQLKNSMLKAQKQPLPSFHLLSSQQIDMEGQLQKSKIQLPQHSYFLQTIAQPIKNQTSQFELHMIISNFNSFIWKVSLIKNTLIVSGMELIGIIRRYNEYSPIQVTSHDDRYFSVLYKSTQNVNISEFLAVYDTEYYVINEQKQIREYFMFSVQRTNDSPVYGNKSQVFQIGNSLFILRENEIKIFQITNLLRMRVQKKMPKQVNNFQESQQQKQSLTAEDDSQRKLDSLRSNDEDPILYSQSIVIFVETPTQLNSVTIKLYSIDFFELSGWTIALIVIGGILVLIILYYAFSELWKYYQKKRKLISLETILVDQASSSERNSHDYERDTHQFDEEEIQTNRPQGRQSQITTQEGTLTKSLLEKYRQFTPQEQKIEENEIKNNEIENLQGEKSIEQ